MKKLVSLTMALMLALAALAVPAMAEENFVGKVGVLTMLNMTEEEMEGIVAAQMMLTGQMLKESGTVDAEEAPTGVPENVIVYYDTLDAMLMALNAGDIDVMNVYANTANYLCAENDQLALLTRLTELDDDQVFTMMAMNGLLANSFSFMMMEGKEALRDEFNAAIDAIAEEGTLGRLFEDHIYGVIYTGEVEPVEMPVIDGAETIKVAITGALPPMDYIAPDGTPAGFNTALLAEISTRIGKNFELVQVDSVGRAAALASGTVDVVFWTRTNSVANMLSGKTEEEKEAEIAEQAKFLTEDQAAVMESIDAIVDFGAYGNVDMPEGTIITEPYCTDWIVPVVTKASLEAMSAR